MPIKKEILPILAFSKPFWLFNDLCIYKSSTLLATADIYLLKPVESNPKKAVEESFLKDNFYCEKNCFKLRG